METTHNTESRVGAWAGILALLVGLLLSGKHPVDHLLKAQPDRPPFPQPSYPMIPDATPSIAIPGETLDLCLSSDWTSLEGMHSISAGHVAVEALQEQVSSAPFEVININASTDWGNQIIGKYLDNKPLNVHVQLKLPEDDQWRGQEARLLLRLQVKYPHMTKRDPGPFLAGEFEVRAKDLQKQLTLRFATTEEEQAYREWNDPQHQEQNLNWDIWARQAPPIGGVFLLLASVLFASSGWMSGDRTLRWGSLVPLLLAIASFLLTWLHPVVQLPK